MSASTALLFTRAQAAGRLTVSLRYVDVLVRRGVLPVVRLGRRAVRIPASAVEQLALRGIPPERPRA